MAEKCARLMHPVAYSRMSSSPSVVVAVPLEALDEAYGSQLLVLELLLGSGLLDVSKTVRMMWISPFMLECRRLYHAQPRTHVLHVYSHAA